MSQDAFPSPGVVLPGGHQQGAYAGMTLRDYFAASAVPVFSWRLGGQMNTWKANAAACYEIADAMLNAREK